MHLAETQISLWFPWPDAMCGASAMTGDSDFRIRPGRIRSTRALWDPSYTDESWIKDRVELIPRLLRRGYVDAQAGDPQPTFPAERPRVRIDYICLSAPLAPALRWCRPWITEETAAASDHLPVLAEIDL